MNRLFTPLSANGQLMMLISSRKFVISLKNLIFELIKNLCMATIIIFIIVQKEATIFAKNKFLLSY